MKAFFIERYGSKHKGRIGQLPDLEVGATT